MTARKSLGGPPISRPVSRPISRPSLQLAVQFASDDDLNGIGRGQLRRWVRSALQADAMLLLRFVDEVEGRELNGRFRGKDRATNVLTFSYDASPVQADIVICIPVVRAEASTGGVPFRDHLAHLVVHGVLHAQGHDHIEQAQAETMEAIERDVLARFGIADPYMARDAVR